MSFYCRKNQVRGRSVELEICTFQEGERRWKFFFIKERGAVWLVLVGWWGGGVAE